MEDIESFKEKVKETFGRENPETGEFVTNDFFVKALYLTMFLIMCVLGWVLRDFVHPDFNLWGPGCHSHDKEGCYSKAAILRIGLGLFVFFFTMCMIMVGTRTQQDFRVRIQNEYWLYKFILFAFVMGFAWLIPVGILPYFAYISIAGGCFFLFIQVILLINFSYQWNEDWVEKEWFGPILGVSALIGLAALVGIILLFVFFGTGCAVNTFFITFTLVGSILIIGLVFFPNDSIRGSLLSSVTVSAYCVFLCASAILSETEEHCNRFSSHGSTTLWFSIISILVGLFSLTYSLYYAASAKGVFDLSSSPSNQEEMQLIPSSTEPESLSYSFSFFHLILSTGAMYFCMLFTGWSLTNMVDEKYRYNIGTAAMAIQFSTEALTMLLYLYSMISPMFFDRDYD